MNNKVVLITWPPSSFSSEHLRGSALPSEGHSALQIEFSGRQVYISFWPGKCKSWHREEPWLCQKEEPHFHASADEDDLTMKRGGNKINLCGLDVAQMVRMFDELHDENMNAYHSWRVYNNCSDITLKLLEIGGLFKYDNVDRYKMNIWVPIIIGIACSSVIAIGMMNATIYSRDGQVYKLSNLIEPIIESTRQFITMSPSILQRKIWDSLYKIYWFLDEFELSGFAPLLRIMKFFINMTEPSTNFPSNVYATYWVQFYQNKFIANLIGLSATCFVSGFLSSYLSYMILSFKSISPVYVKHFAALDQAIQIGLGMAVLLIAEAGSREGMKYNHIPRPTAPILPMEIAVNYLYMPFIGIINKILCNRVSWPIVLGLPLMILVVPLFMRALYDTTVTPKYLLSLVNDRKHLLQEEKREEHINFEVSEENTTDLELASEDKSPSLYNNAYQFFNSVVTNRKLWALGGTAILGATVFWGMKNIEAEVISKLSNHRP